MIKVCVVDDHAVVREGLKRIISENPGMAVTAEAGDGFEALKVIKSEPCDVVLLDITMPNKSGLDVLKELHTESPRLPVLVLSMHAEDQYAVRVLRAGAAGYLTKESAPAKLIQAIRKVVRGGKYVSPTLAEKLVYDLDIDKSKAPHEILSDREYQVLCMIASGKTVTEIAGELALSVKTISTYRVRILEKLNFKNNAELTRYAIKEGLVD
ncbi:MAG TPA: response regulator transcription factor [Terriglobia bacterium]|nr:response regulator transcription factor [Terriglobia bacterium]